MTVALRALVTQDSEWLNTWLPSIAKVVGYGTDSAESLRARLRGERELRVQIIERGKARVGVVVFRLHTPKRGSASFELVATPPEHARSGAGMIAAALAEDEMQSAGVRAAYAPAAAMHGISMYFWIRLGYAPLLRPEWPCECDGIAWLRRGLDRR